MRHKRLAAALLAVALAVVLLPGQVGASPARGSALTTVIDGVLRTLRPACGQPAIGFASCDALIVTPTANAAAATVTGLSPANIQNAYRLPANGTGTVAIVDAYDDPKAESDLAAYRSHWRLPACTTANRCFRKLNQSGVQGSYPSGDTGWGTEISLDLDAVSAACPHCSIILVEARSTSIADLAAAVDTAARFHPNAISNSYGGNEASDEAGSDRHYHHPGIAITVSAGDSGYGVEYPAASPYVTAVGGTTLTKDSSARGWTETVWGSSGGLLGLTGSDGTGSGCSAYEPKPSWQHDPDCGQRTVADVAAVADPATGLAIYDSYGQSGWLQVGGTSLAAPVIASVYAMAHNLSRVDVPASYAYSHHTSLFDVTSGSNGSCASGLIGLGSNTYLCQAGPGYDGPTGLGTPNGLGAF
jgi:hypothetical protein